MEKTDILRDTGRSVGWTTFAVAQVANLLYRRLPNRLAVAMPRRLRMIQPCD
jgi:hypothetical protein